jgi:hypothetical protein
MITNHRRTTKEEMYWDIMHLIYKNRELATIDLDFVEDRFNYHYDGTISSQEFKCCDYGTIQSIIYGKVRYDCQRIVEDYDDIFARS